MGYIEENLLPNEQIVYKAKAHPAAVMISKSLTILMIFAPIFLFYAGELAFAALALIICVPIAWAGLSDAITRTTMQLGVTDQRVIMRAGFLQKKSFEIPLSKVEGISVEQGLLDRIVGAGYITIIGVGGSHNFTPPIDNPKQFRMIVQEQIQKNTSQLSNSKA